MAINRNAKGGGSIQPGEYRVRVKTLEKSTSKKGSPMLVVVFALPDEKEVKAYFAKNVEFHMHNLRELKIACGLTEGHEASGLLGKECGILVELGEPNDHGRIWPEVTGYGPVSALGGSTGGQPSGFADGPPMEDVPF